MNEPNRIKLFIAIVTTTVIAFMETFRYAICNKNCLSFTKRQEKVSKFY